MRARPAPSRGSRGFTLLAITVVLFIAGIATALVGPSVMRCIGGTRLKASVRRLATTLRYARSLAISHHALVGVTFDLDGGNYSLEFTRAAAPPPPPRNNEDSEDPWSDTAAADAEEDEDSESAGARQREPRLPPPGNLPQPLTFLEFELGPGFNADEGRAEIWFFPKGNSTGGAVTVGKPDGDRSIVVEVDPITGMVRLEELSRW